MRVPPPAIYLAGFLAGYLLQRWRSLSWLQGRFNYVVASLLVVAGAALVLDFIVRFARARTTTSPTGAASSLITGGAYRFTRNPGYLGWVLAYAGIAMLLSWPWPLLLLPLVVLALDRLVIAPEERFLDETFGEEYRAYRRRVRRWL